MDEPAQGYSKRPDPHDVDAAMALKKRTLTNLYNGPVKLLAHAASWPGLCKSQFGDVLQRLLTPVQGGFIVGVRHGSICLLPDRQYEILVPPHVTKQLAAPHLQSQNHVVHPKGKLVAIRSTSRLRLKWKVGHVARTRTTTESILRNSNGRKSFTFSSDPKNAVEAELL